MYVRPAVNVNTKARGFERKAHTPAISLLLEGSSQSDGLNAGSIRPGCLATEGLQMVSSSSTSAKLPAVGITCCRNCSNC